MFFEDLKVNKCNNGVCKWEHGVFGKDLVEREDEQLQKFEGKLKKI